MKRRIGFLFFFAASTWAQNNCWMTYEEITPTEEIATLNASSLYLKNVICEDFKIPQFQFTHWAGDRYVFTTRSKYDNASVFGNTVWDRHEIKNIQVKVADASTCYSLALKIISGISVSNSYPIFSGFPSNVRINNYIEWEFDDAIWPFSNSSGMVNARSSQEFQLGDSRFLGVIENLR